MPTTFARRWALLTIPDHCKLQDIALSVQKLGMALHANNSSTWEAGAGGWNVQDHPELHSEL